MDKVREGTLKRMAEREKMERNEDHITCPYCDWVNNEPEDEYEFVTYHGEACGTFECPACGKKFVVEEQVTRTFVTKQLQCEELERRDRAGWALSRMGGDVSLAAEYARIPEEELKAIIEKHNIDWEQYSS